MDVRVEDGHEASVVSVSGDVDLSTSRELQAQLRSAVAGPAGKLIVDLGGVPYMDSSGVATLVETMQLSRERGKRLVLSSMSERVRSIFEIARLDTVFTIVGDLDEAKRA